MPDSAYNVIQLIGASTESCEEASTTVLECASHSLRDLRVAERVKLDLVIENGKVSAYRAKLRVSFKDDGAAQSSTLFDDVLP